MLEEAFESLKKYEWGTDPAVLKAIDEAVVTTHGHSDDRAKLESQLAGLLGADIPRAAKDYVCRKLMVIGTAASVPALAALLTHAELSHMARFALEQIPGSEAVGAIQDAMAKTTGAQRIGMMSSLGSRGEASAVAALSGLLSDSDASVARAAALALGHIPSAESAGALAKAKSADASVQTAAVDASFACAEKLLASGKKLEALAIYKRLAAGDPAKHVKLAATRGMLACTSSGASTK